VSTDPAAVHADDELLDNLGAGQVPDGDPVTTGLAAWRADVDAEPIPEPQTGAESHRDGRWVRWWRHQQVRTAWLRGGQL
jgi:hypothetical protein